MAPSVGFADSSPVNGGAPQPRGSSLAKRGRGTVRSTVEGAHLALRKQDTSQC